MMTDTPLLFSRRTTAASPDDIPLDWEIHHSEAAVLTLADGTMAPPQIATSVRSLWSERFLFVLFAGHFQQLRLMPEAGDLLVKTPELWNHSDVFEAFLGVEARSTSCYFEFQVAPDGRWLDLAIDRARASAYDETWVSGLRCRVLIDTAQGLWRTVLGIPWTVWSNGPTSLEGNFYRASGAYHGDELLAWSPTGYGDRCFHRPERFGRLVLL